MPDKYDNEIYFYPDKNERFWWYRMMPAVGIFSIFFPLMIIFFGRTPALGVILLCFDVMMLLYFGMFMAKAPQVYMDKNKNYLRLQTKDKSKIIYVKDIQSYDYFVSYSQPLEYPYLSLRVQLFLTSGKTEEFFAFLKGVDGVIEKKMASIGIRRRNISR